MLSVKGGGGSLFVPVSRGGVTCQYLKVLTPSLVWCSDCLVGGSGRLSVTVCLLPGSDLGLLPVGECLGRGR